MRYPDQIDRPAGDPSVDPGRAGRERAADWENDFDLLKSIAFLSGTTPYNLLRKVSWSVGETRDARSFHLGRPLSAATRSRLESLFDERLIAEQETIQNCREVSAQIVNFVPYALGLLVALLLLQ